MSKKITTLVVGATGKTGKLLVEQLLDQGCIVRAVVRLSSSLSTDVIKHPNIEVIESSILEIGDKQLAAIVKDCDAVISCLGHTMSFKGVFGEPRKLCTETTRRLCNAIEINQPIEPVKFILMNTVGVSNPDLNEKRTWGERIVLTLLRNLIPPHNDNEQAFDYLHAKVGKRTNNLEWCSVRPDSLVDAEVSQYQIIESPVTGLFTGRPTARANVAHFMAKLIRDNKTWEQWKFKTPVIMNVESKPNDG